MYNSEQSCYSRYEHAPLYTEHSSDGTNEYLVCGKSVSVFFFFFQRHIIKQVSMIFPQGLILRKEPSSLFLLPG